MKLAATIVGAMGMMMAAWTVALFLQAGRPTPSSQWIADAYAIKTAAADRAPAPRLVIVAGSNALFGIDSKMVEEATGMSVVNMGVNAGLLLPYVLLKSQQTLRRGDVVIMPLEYHFYTYDGVPNVQMIDQIWSRDPSFFWDLTFSEQLRMVWMTSASRLMEGLAARGGERAMCGPYGFANIDERGDQTHTSAEEAQQWAYDWDALEPELPRRYGADARHREGWQWLERYARWAKRNGIRLIVMPPTMMEDPFYRADATERRFYEGLAQRVEALGIPFVGNPYDYMYGREYYFNTDYHLTDRGRNHHTRRIIRDLLPVLLRHRPDSGPDK